MFDPKAIEALMKYLSENNISYPRQRSVFGGSYVASRFPDPGWESWNASGFTNEGMDPDARERLMSELYPIPQQRYEFAGPVSHELAHIQQHRSLGGRFQDIALGERSLYGDSSYWTPWTLENDATVGLGKRINDELARLMDELNRSRSGRGVPLKDLGW